MDVGCVCPLNAHTIIYCVIFTCLNVFENISTLHYMYVSTYNNKFKMWSEIIGKEYKKNGIQ